MTEIAGNVDVERDFIGRDVRDRSQNVFVELAQRRHHSDRPANLNDLDDGMLELIKIVEKLHGELELMRYRISQLETTTRFGVFLITIAIVVIVFLVFFLHYPQI